MKKQHRNVVVEYKGRRSRNAGKAKSLWGNLDLNAIAREVQEDPSLPINEVPMTERVLQVAPKAKAPSQATSTPVDLETVEETASRATAASDRAALKKSRVRRKTGKRTSSAPLPYPISNQALLYAEDELEKLEIENRELRLMLVSKLNSENDQLRLMLARLVRP